MVVLSNLRRRVEQAQRALDDADGVGSVVHPHSEPTQPASLLVSVSDSFLVYYERTKRRLCCIDVRNVVSLGQPEAPDKSRAFVIPLDGPLCDGDSVVSLKLSQGQRLLLVSGERTLQIVELRPDSLLARASGRQNIAPLAVLDILTGGKSLLQAEWHPCSDGHLVVLTSDDCLRIYDTVQTLDHEEQKFYLVPDGGGRPLSFAFGPPRAWHWFSVYVLDDTGAMYILCPVIPFGCAIPGRVVEELIALQQNVLDNNVTTSVSRHSPTKATECPARQLDFSTPITSHVSAAREPVYPNSPHVHQAHHRLKWLTESFTDGPHHLNGDVLSVRPLSSRGPSCQGPILLDGLNDGRQLLPMRGIDTMPHGPPAFLVPNSMGEVDIFFLIGDFEPNWDHDESNLAEVVVSNCPVRSAELVHYEKIRVRQSTPSNTGPTSGQSPVVFSIGTSKTSQFWRDFVFVRCGPTGYILKMPWVDDIASGELSRVSRSAPSSLVCIVDGSTPGGDWPVDISGGDALFLYPVGMAAIVLTGRGRIDVLNVESSSNLPQVLHREPSFAAEALDSLPGIPDTPSKGYPNEIEGILQGFHPVPARLTPEHINALNTVELFNHVESRISGFRNGHVQGLAQALAVMQETTRAFSNRINDQRSQIRELQARVREGHVQRASLANKKEQAVTGVNILQERVRKLTAQVHVSVSVLSKSENDFKKRIEGKARELARLSAHSDRLVVAASHNYSPVPEPPCFELRQADQQRIHGALVQHGNALAVLLDEASRLSRNITDIKR